MPVFKRSPRANSKLDSLPDFMEVGNEGGSSTLPQDLEPLGRGRRNEADAGFSPTLPPVWSETNATVPQELDGLVDDTQSLDQAFDLGIDLQPERLTQIEHVIAGPSVAINYPVGGPGAKAVLMVDDDLTARLYMRAKLMLRGNVELVEATDGAQGLSLLERRDFDAVLLDVDMGSINGFEVCKAIRRIVREQGGKQPKVFMVTSRSGMLDKMRAKMAGADAFLSKPPHPNELALLLADL
jgi:CheY-like chemotaxis protein